MNEVDRHMVTTSKNYAISYIISETCAKKTSSYCLDVCRIIKVLRLE